MSERIFSVRSEVGARPRPEDAADPAEVDGGAVDDRVDEPAADEPAVDETGSRRRRRTRRAERADDEQAPGRRARLSLPLVPVLAVLLVLLLAGAGYLWATRPDPSSVRTADYSGALLAARSGVVDITSFDHLTLDDDIRQIERVATGDLKDEAVAQLDDHRDELAKTEAVVNTEVVGAGVTRADDENATVLMVIQSTQKTNASEQAQVVRYRIQVDLTKSGDRWKLSGITGTGQ